MIRMRTVVVGVLTEQPQRDRAAPLVLGTRAAVVVVVWVVLVVVVDVWVVPLPVLVVAMITAAT